MSVTDLRALVTRLGEKHANQYASIASADAAIASLAEPASKLATDPELRAAYTAAFNAARETAVRS